MSLIEFQRTNSSINTLSHHTEEKVLCGHFQQSTFVTNQESHAPSQHKSCHIDVVGNHWVTKIWMRWLQNGEVGCWSTIRNVLNMIFTRLSPAMISHVVNIHPMWCGKWIQSICPKFAMGGHSAAAGCGYVFCVFLVFGLEWSACSLWLLFICAFGCCVNIGSCDCIEISFNNPTLFKSSGF